MKVLIVDDNEQARRMIKHYLREFSDEFRECVDGADALEAYAEFLPDWVLMDVELPLMDGIAAARQITDEDSQARVVMLTNHTDARLRQAAREAGACGYVLKENLFDLLDILRTDVLEKTGE